MTQPTPYHTALTALRRQPPGTPPANRVFGAGQTLRRAHPDLLARQALTTIRAAADHLRLTDVTGLLDRDDFRGQVARRLWGNRQAQPGTIGAAAATRVRVARRLVGWVAEPGLGLTPAKARKVRVAVAWIGLRILDTDGWDTTLFTGNRMAAELGLGKAPTARAWLKLAAAGGVQPEGRQPAITIRQKRPGGGVVVALRQLGHPQREALLDLVNVVDDLAAVAEFGIKPHTLPATAVLTTVGHPLWTYSNVVGVQDWDALVQYLFRMGGGTFPVDGKWVPVAVRRILERLRQLGIEPDAPSTDLLAAIDAAAGRTRAYERKRDAEEAAAAATAARMEAMAKERDRTKALTPVVAAIMADCPPVDGDHSRRDAWLVHARQIAVGVPEAALPHLERRLVRVLVRDGWESDRASKVAGWLCQPLAAA